MTILKMQNRILFALVVSQMVLFSCNSTNSNQGSGSDTSLVVRKEAVANGDKGTTVANDQRAQDELIFLNRIKAESDYEITSNAAKKDVHIAAFNKYALDSLKKVSGWEMIVTEINDNRYDQNKTAKVIFGGAPAYNLKLVAPIKIDKTADSIAVDNRVDFTVTVPKNANSEMLKAQLNVIKNLSRGDTVIVGGSITHLDEVGKVNFASFYDGMANWNLDLLATDIQKKASRRAK